MQDNILYIKDGVLIDPEQDRMYPADLLIEQGRIKKIFLPAQTQEKSRERRRKAFRPMQRS